MEEEQKVVVLELRVEWKVVDPLKYKPREWLLTFDRATNAYLYRVMESLKGKLAQEYPDETQQELIAVDYIQQYYDEIVNEIQKMKHPVPIRITKFGIRTIDLNAFSLYYQRTRK